MLKYKSLYLINNSIKDYIYSSNNNKLYESTEKFSKVFTFLSKQNSKKDNILSEFDEKELLEITESLERINNVDDLTNIYYPKQIKAICIFLTEDCNFRCTYCYEKPNDKKVHKMTVDIANKTLDFLIKNTKYDDLSIILFGGEPLLAFDLLRYIVEYSKQLGIIHNKNIMFSITTNGSLITEEVKQYLSDNKISVQVSIDGNKKTIDKNRIFKDGNSTFDHVVTAINDIVKENKVTARATITNNNLIEHQENFQFLYNFGFKRMFFTPAFNTLNQNAVEQLITIKYEYIDEFIRLIKEKNYNKCIAMGDIIKLFKDIHHAEIKKVHCGAYNTYLAVSFNGDIYPCHRFVGEDKFKLGNVSNTKYISDEIVINKVNKCNDCICKSVCAGGCIHDNYIMSGKPNLPADIYCDYNIALIKKVLIEYTKLNAEEKRIFE